MQELEDFGGPFYTDEKPDLELVTPFLFSHRKKEDNGSNSKHTSHSVPTLGEHSQLQARMTSKEAMDEYEQRRATTPNPITLEAFEQVCGSLKHKRETSMLKDATNANSLLLPWCLEPAVVALGV